MTDGRERECGSCCNEPRDHWVHNTAGQHAPGTTPVKHPFIPKTQERVDNAASTQREPTENERAAIAEFMGTVAWCAAQSMHDRLTLKEFKHVGETMFAPTPQAVRDSVTHYLLDEVPPDEDPVIKLLAALRPPLASEAAEGELTEFVDAVKTCIRHINDGDADVILLDQAKRVVEESTNGRAVILPYDVWAEAYRRATREPADFEAGGEEDWLQQSLTESSRRARALPDWKRELVAAQEAVRQIATRSTMRRDYDGYDLNGVADQLGDLAARVPDFEECARYGRRLREIAQVPLCDADKALLGLVADLLEQGAPAFQARGQEDK